MSPAAGAALLLTLGLGAGCGAPVAGLYPPRGGEPTVEVWVVAHGWHAGLAVRVADVPAGAWPERSHFPDADFLELGWGDRAYWQHENPGVRLALDALLRPTPSAVRIVGVRGPLAPAFPGAEIVDLRLSHAGFARLVRFVDDSIAREGAGAATPLGATSWPDIRFYPARPTYHLFRTSNTWTAAALRAAGFPIAPASALTAGGVLRQVRAGRAGGRRRGGRISRRASRGIVGAAGPEHGDQHDRATDIRLASEPDAGALCRRRPRGCGDHGRRR
ncbi:MAG TPA: DUF2459 domain-containing protein [Candidatus Limnocylindria bacterium]|nr:DUF2459 domain-containing protein [Candidatus Limnocylindria bacterium]